MDFSELIFQIIQVCVIPLLGILTKFAVDLLSAKRDEINARTNNEKVIKYTNMIHDTIRDCVIATEQTYVDDLKKAGKFDTESQKKALNDTVNAVMNILHRDVKEYIEETTNDATQYITQLIEAEIKKNKGA